VSTVVRSWARRALLCASLLLAAAVAPAAAADGPQPFGHSCAVQPSGVRFCPTPAPSSSSDQRPRSWDGTPLQVDVTLPETGDGPWPVIVMLPGYGGSDGVSWESFGTSSGSNEGDNFNNVGFAKQGYAVVTMNFRGVGYSCGPPYGSTAIADDAARRIDPACQGVSFHFADQRYDSHDVQWVLGSLVDQGIAKRDGLGVIGESLGSLVTNELALLYNRIRQVNGRFAPWRSPAGTLLHIAAAYPIWALSDLVDATAPNGHFLSFEPRTATKDAEPLGAIKTSVPMSLAAVSPVDTWTDPTKPRQFNLLIDGPLAQLAAPDGPGMRALVREIHDYHQAVGMPIGSGVAPILMEDGWGDLLVNGATQALRLADYLKRAAPSAKIALQLTDVGHPLDTNKAGDFPALNAQAFAFFKEYLQGGPEGPAPGSITAYAATCPGSAASGELYTADGMAKLAPGAVRFSAAKAQTVAGGGDPSIGVALDPIFETGAQPGAGTVPECQPFDAVDVPGTAVFTHPVTHAFTTLGLPTMRMHVATIGNHGQLNARLWDVARDGTETYVSRGTYALTNDQTGTITWQMWGAGHTFPAGHTIRVELLAQDVPLQRPSRTPFAVSVSGFTLELPTREPPDGGHIEQPALARYR
jgi:hypothetical protein